MTLIDNKHFCILPWIHLHVAQNGRVSPCCNNNRHLGNVQEQSLKAIWNSNKFEELRERRYFEKPSQKRKVQKEMAIGIQRKNESRRRFEDGSMIWGMKNQNYTAKSRPRRRTR